MAHSARKPTASSSKRKPAARAAAKAVSKTTRPVARVSEGARGQLAVLANDPEFQTRVAQQLVAGAAAGKFAQIIRGLLTGLAPAPLVSDDAMMAAAEFMAEVAKHNGPPPSDDELDEMVRSWA